METPLSTKECDVLIEALEAWESKDLSKSMMNIMIRSLVPVDDPVAKEKMDREMKERQDKDEQECRFRKEVSTLLKAKLIQLKHQMQTDDMVTASNR